MEPGGTAYRARFAVTLLFLGVGLLALWQAKGLPFGTISFVRAGFFPKVFGALVVILSVLVLGELLRARRKRSVEATPAETDAPPQNQDEPRHGGRVALMSGVFFLYPVLAVTTGHLVASVVSLWAAGFLLGVRNPWKLGLMAISVALVTWYIFANWLSVPLPTPFWYGR